MHHRCGIGSGGGRGFPYLDIFLEVLEGIHLVMVGHSRDISQGT